MKRIVFSVVFTFILAFVVQAQTNPKNIQEGPGGSGPGNGPGTPKQRTPEERANALTRRMKQELSLDSNQTKQVRQLNLTKAQQIQQTRAKYANDPQSRAKECKAIRQKWEADLKGVLNADQWKTYQVKKQERIQKAKERRANGPKSNKPAEEIEDEIEEEIEG